LTTKKCFSSCLRMYITRFCLPIVKGATSGPYICTTTSIIVAVSVHSTAIRQQPKLWHLLVICDGMQKSMCGKCLGCLTAYASTVCNIKQCCYVCKHGYDMVCMLIWQVQTCFSSKCILYMPCVADHSLQGALTAVPSSIAHCHDSHNDLISGTD